MTMARVGTWREYFEWVISTAELRARLENKWVAVDKFGAILDIEIPADIGPAALLVAPVTDALKEVDEQGRVLGSVDRARMWAVEAIVLNEIAVRRLQQETYTVGDLLDAVRESGLAWQVRPTSVP